MPIDARLNGAAVRNFAGCAIEPVDPETLQTRLLARFGSGERGLIIGHHNLHSLYLYQHDSEARTFYQRCHTCYVDGMGVLWLLRAAGIDTREALRFSLMDCLPDFLLSFGIFRRCRPASRPRPENEAFAGREGLAPAGTV